jgi:hypothetical protein
MSAHGYVRWMMSFSFSSFVCHLLCLYSILDHSNLFLLNRCWMVLDMVVFLLAVLTSCCLCRWAARVWCWKGFIPSMALFLGRQQSYLVLWLARVVVCCWPCMYPCELCASLCWNLGLWSGSAQLCKLIPSKLHFLLICQVGFATWFNVVYLWFFDCRFGTRSNQGLIKVKMNFST